VLLNNDVDLKYSSCGVKVISDDRKTPNPAGFWLKEEISPPRAVKAPPIDINLAVPV
jgi:hypothetical protein